MNYCNLVTPCNTSDMTPITCRRRNATDLSRTESAYSMVVTKISINVIRVRARRLLCDECNFGWALSFASSFLPIDWGSHLLWGCSYPDAISQDLWSHSSNRQTLRRACQRTPRPICAAVAL